MSRPCFTSWASLALASTLACNGASGADADEPMTMAGARSDASSAGGDADAGDESSEVGEGGQTTSSTGTGAGPCTPPLPSDDFSGDELDPDIWRSVGASGIRGQIVDGRLTFVPTPGHMGTRTVLLRTVDAFDLTECNTWVEVPRVLPEDVQGELTWALYADGQNTAFIRVRRPGISFVISSDEIVEESVEFDEAAHRWWRFRDEGGVLYLETSPDASDWTATIEYPHEWDLSMAGMGFNPIVNIIVDNFDGPQFDNLNVLP